MPYSVASYADIGGSPFQQYENQQQQFQLQRQQIQNQQNQQQNAPLGGQQYGQQGYGPTYGQQQQYGGFQQQYNPLPNYNLNMGGFQPTPINQSDYTTYRSAPESPIGQTYVQNPQLPGLNLNLNSAEQNYLKQQQPQQPQQTNPTAYSFGGYNSLPNYNPYQYSSPAGGTGQYYSFF